MATSTDGGQTPADRGVINQEPPGNNIPYLGWRQTDAIFVGGIAILGLLIGNSMAGGWISIVMAVLGGICGLLAVYAKPDGINIIESIRIGWDYIIQPNIIYSASSDADSERKNSGGLLNKTPFKPEETTRNFTNIKLIFPGERAVLTTDGRVERVIEIEGQNMDFSSAGVWASRQEKGQEFADRHIEDRVKFYYTTRDFDFDAITQRLEKRLEQRDVKNAPAAKQVLKEYKNNRPEKMRSRGTQEIKSYIVISVAKSDVSTGYSDEQTPVEKLSTIPLLGILVERFVGVENENEVEQSTNEMMVDQLNQLSQKVKDDLIRETEGYTFREVTAVEQVMLFANLFNDRQVSENQVEYIMQDGEESKTQPEVDDSEVSP